MSETVTETHELFYAGEFDSDYIADSLGEAQPENTRLPSYRSMLSNVSRGTVHMEPVPRKTYVPVSYTHLRAHETEADL
eukprot:2409978-Rhodomonas_salina.1